MEPLGTLIPAEDIATLKAAGRILDALSWPTTPLSANLRNRANAGAHYIELVIEDVTA